jgi:16S rRNA (cytidine1402-2'-O)-methyltransferase
MKILFVVATPIGNLADITFRAIETLKNVDLVLAEDTRHTKILFNHYGITTQLQSCHAQTSPEKIDSMFAEFKEGSTIAIVSDAGTPGISDPGFRAVRAAVKYGFTVSPIPGASAVVSLVSVSGIPADTFTFHGFLPHKKGRQTLLKEFAETERAQIFYESVHRFPKLLEELTEFCGEERVIVIGRELTKMHEEIFRGTVAQAKDHFTTENIRGEFVILLAGKKFSSTVRADGKKSQ